MTTTAPVKNDSKQKPAEKSTAPVGTAQANQWDDDDDDFVEDKSLDIKGFYKPELKDPVDGSKLNRLRGYILAIRQRPVDEDEPEKTPGKYFLVQLTRPCMAKSPEKNSKEIVQLSPGDIIWADIRFDMEKAVAYLPRRVMGMPTLTELIYQPLEKIQNGKKSLWKGEMKHKNIKGKAIKDIGLDSLIPEFGEKLTAASRLLGGSTPKMLAASQEVEQAFGAEDDIPF